MGISHPNVHRMVASIALLAATAIIVAAGVFAAVQPAHAADQSVEPPTVATTLVYNGQEQRGVAEGDGYTLTGTVTAVDAGTYTATATLKEGYHWASGSDDALQITWDIRRKPIAEPVGKTLVYDGEEMNALDDGSLSPAAPQVCLGASHSAALLANGDLYMWGNNFYGQIGDGTTVTRTTPVKVLSDVKQVSLGASHSAALLRSGNLYTWGWNSSGQIGDGTTETRTAPVKVLSGVRQVSLGSFHSAALLENGDLYMWGNNKYGQLALNDTSIKSYPTPTKVLSGVKQVSLGSEHSAALLQDGSLYTWGRNSCGQLGLGSADTYAHSSPTKVDLPSGVVQVSLGGSHSAAVLADGSLYTWGDNSCGQLGLGSAVTWNCYAPTKVASLSDVVQVTAGGSNTAAFLADGSLYTWGWNNCGQLGLGTTENCPTPTQVNLPSDVVQVSMGSNHSAMALENGSLYMWGWNSSGQLGDGTTENRSTPTSALIPECFGSSAYNGGVEGDEDVVVLFTYANGDASDAVVATEVGTYRCYASPGVNYCWWPNGATAAKVVEWAICTSVEPPTMATDLVYSGQEQRGVAEGEGYTLSGTATAVDAGTYTATATLDDERYCWSDGTTDPKVLTWTISPKPIAVPEGKELVYDGDEKNPLDDNSLSPSNSRVSLGAYHSAALLDNGDLYMWGKNYRGQIGDGTTEDRTAPVKVLSGVAQVSLGSSHSAAVLDNGDLYTWGYNNCGQLGLGVDAAETCPIPTKVTSLSKVAQVSLAGDQTAAILEDGSLYTWGHNESGQLGDGTTEDRWTPTKVTSLSNVKQVSLGAYHSAAVTADGWLYTWGRNTFGQLGLGDTDKRTTPTKVTSLSGVVQVSVGGSNTAAVVEGGSLYTWGDNFYGQLGLGDVIKRTTPTKVASLSGVRQISLGYSYSAAVLSNGDLYTWGSNSYGQLGDNTTEDRETPVKVLSGVRQVSLGSYHSAALLDAGDLYTWGSNDSGQLGLGNKDDCLVPTPALVPKIYSSCYRSNAYAGGVGRNEAVILLFTTTVGIDSDAVVATAIGGYRCYASPGVNYCWSDGTRNPVELTWTVSPKPVAVPEGKALVYIGQEQRGVAEGEDYTLTGTTTAVDVGTYTVTAALGDANYTWVDGTTDPKTVEWTIAPAMITSVTATDQAYTGKALEPVPTVMAGELTVPVSGYTASYANNTEAGTATVTVTGKGNYAGTASGTFKIKRNIAGATVTAADQVYTGSALTPAPKVELGGKALVAGADYAVSYSNNTEVGTATVTVTGKGDYAGTASGTFAIAPASLAKATVTVADQAYTGEALTPAPKVVLGGKALVAGTDYTVSYSNNTEVGTATVTVTGEGDYTGTATGTFEITAAPEPEPDPEPTPDPEPVDRAWTRLAGGDRFGTMQAITLEGYESADTVLVATGIDFADALAAAGLSGVLKAPIVTTMPGFLSDEAKVAMQELGAKEAIILGGTNAVSADVEEQLEAMGLTTSRLAGDNRIDTAVKIWERGGSSWGGTCILSKGWVAADALAAGSLAYADAAPLFLALPDGTLTPDTAAAVKTFEHVVVLGGTQGDAAISDKTAKSLGTSWMRVAGDTRYETATALATWASGGDTRAAFQPAAELSWDDCAVAFAWNYPDALVGVNATGPKASVTLLASTDADDFTQGVASSVAEHAGEVSHGYVLGGTGVVSDAVKQLFEEAAK